MKKLTDEEKAARQVERDIEQIETMILTLPAKAFESLRIWFGAVVQVKAQTAPQISLTVSSHLTESPHGKEAKTL